ncbi:MAG TPA: peptidylprolyl isomerase [Candidatus Thermoplasmatota archaeon]|nr:peptidylprolyl isomerase [Candidatus Thermoplasmatota archaeon]
MTNPLVTVETTAGDLVLELDPVAAPRTVENFLAYVRAGFYAGLVFHRVIPRFVAQAGGYDAARARKAPLRPPVPLERSTLKHADGALGMARLPEPNTATSEFYLCDGAQPDLDGNYCVFGRLKDGRDALARILASPTKSGDWPVEPPVILRAYEGAPDPANPAPRHEPPKKAAPPPDVEAVRAAAKKLRGRAALLRAKRPLAAIGDVEAAIAQADRTGSRADLERAEALLAEKERK